MIYPCVMDDYLAEYGVVPLDIANVPKKPVGIYQMNESAQDDRIADIVTRLQAASRAKLPQLFDWSAMSSVPQRPRIVMRHH